MPESNGQVVVLGMHRSGTSAMCQALRRMGFDFGPKGALYPADENNPTGYYERTELIELNHALLASFQLDSMSIEPLSEAWLEHPMGERAVQTLADYLHHSFSDSPLWALKQPMISPLLPVYREAFSRLGLSPHYLLMVRNPLEVIQSEMRWRFQGDRRIKAPLGSRALALWLRYTLAPLYQLQACEVSVVSYDRLLTEPTSTLNGLSTALAAFGVTEESFQAASRALKPSLRHHATDPAELDRWPAVFGDAYRTVAKLAEDPDGFREGRFDGSLRELNLAFERLIEVFATPPLSAGILGLATVGLDQRKIYEQTYFPCGRWQTVSLAIDAPPDTLLAGSLYNLPCNIWIRGAGWKTPDAHLPALLEAGPLSQLTTVGPMRLLKGVFESKQIQVRTPPVAGPYTLELDFFLEATSRIALETVDHLLGRLEHR